MLTRWFKQSQNASGPSPDLRLDSSCPLEAHDLTVAYHKRPVLYGVDLKISPGQLVGVVGPNGAGKSTFLKAIIGLVPASGGWVRVFGESFQDVTTRVAYVPQRESVDWDFPVSVMDVVLMGRYGRLKLGRRPTVDDYSVAEEA
ncbi:MAG TPA: ATP-binding cassette domain-containing protein, partial [Opitutales bacterium]|nr:ATP-binding cassette domain-containing protein [Opitutales bacterium]